MDNKNVVLVKNGFVKKVLTHNGEILDTKALYVFEDDQYCPICDTKLIWGQNKYCTNCKLNWVNCSDEDILKAYNKYEGGEDVL